MEFRQLIDKNILSSFEANLCSILYSVLGDTSIGQVMPKVRQSLAYQGCLSSDAIHLVQDALAKGMTHWLAVRGGWHSDRHLRDGVASTGAIWQRSAPSDLGLTFSPASLRFLIWLTANDPLATHADPTGLLKDLTVGDQLLILRALLRFQDTEITERLVRMRALAELPLVALVFPRQVSLRQNHVVPKFSESLPELGWVLECLQPFLAERWMDMELSKSTITDVFIMRRMGAMQTALLSSYFNAAEQHGRLDLARFLLAVFQRLVANDIPPEPLARRWIAGCSWVRCVWLTELLSINLRLAF